jgi:uncharacterized protein YycO
MSTQDLTPGDFILAHRNHVIARLISFAQSRRFRGRDAKYAHWSHAAVVDEDDHVIEAEIRGVVRSPISKYHPGEYTVVALDGRLDAEQRRKVVAYAREQIGQAFGFLDMAGAAVYLLTGRPLRMVRKHHEICSSLVVRALHKGGLLKELDPALTLPADLAKRFDAP